MHRFLCFGLLVLLVGLNACRRGDVAPARTGFSGDAQRGQRLLRSYGCGACHTIPGVRGARGLVGPPLNAFAQRSYIAGRLPNTGENLVLWIVNPKGVDSLTAMPMVGVTAADARHMAAYLYTLERGGLGPPHLLPERWLHQLGRVVP